jgi:chromosome segregation ATPase
MEFEEQIQVRRRELDAETKRHAEEIFRREKEVEEARLAVEERERSVADWQEQRRLAEKAVAEMERQRHLTDAERASLVEESSRFRKQVDELAAERKAFEQERAKIQLNSKLRRWN